MKARLLTTHFVARVLQNDDDATVKAEALQLGVIPALERELRARTGPRTAAVIEPDGDRLVAIIAWAGFASAADNQWCSLTIAPANEQTALWLKAAVELLVESDDWIVREEAPLWKN